MHECACAHTHSRLLLLLARRCHAVNVPLRLLPEQLLSLRPVCARQVNGGCGWGPYVDPGRALKRLGHKSTCMPSATHAHTDTHTHRHTHTDTHTQTNHTNTQRTQDTQTQTCVCQGPSSRARRAPTCASLRRATATACARPAARRALPRACHTACCLCVCVCVCVCACVCVLCWKQYTQGCGVECHRTLAACNMA
jgi:hypothetical protein